MSKKYNVMVDGKPLESHGEVMFYTRGEAIKKARAWNGKIKEAKEPINILLEQLLDKKTNDSLYNLIVKEMRTDEEKPSRISRQLLQKYFDNNDSEREIIDYTFCSLTGWEFKTLVNKLVRRNEHAQ